MPVKIKRPKPASKTKSKAKQDWPKSTKVLWRPDRLQYLKRARTPKNESVCVFCEALALGPSLESLVVKVFKHTMILLNKFPYNNGHLLVLPRRHEGEFTALSVEESQELQESLRFAVDALQKAYQPGGLNVGANLGAAAGAGIPQHLHFHVVPRWNGDTNFFPLIGDTKVISETLEQTYNRLLPYLNEV